MTHAVAPSLVHSGGKLRRHSPSSSFISYSCSARRQGGREKRVLSPLAAFHGEQIRASTFRASPHTAWVGLPSIRLRNSCTDVRCTTSICRDWLIGPEWACRGRQAGDCHVSQRASSCLVLLIGVPCWQRHLGTSNADRQHT